MTSLHSVLLGVCLAAAAGDASGGVSSAIAGQEGGAAAEAVAFLAKVDAAQRELQNGRAEPFRALWSHADDVTLSGGFGGTIEKGWPAVSSRLDWVGTQFSNGTNRIERLVSNTNGSLSYVIQLEHLRFRVPGETAETTRDYRVTMIFRREAAGWRIVHRQADSQLSRVAPK